MTTVLRPTIARALSSIFAQQECGQVQLLIGIDRRLGGAHVLADALKDCPPFVTATVIDPGYSTSRRHGGLYEAFDGGSLRTALSFLANSRHLTYLDDDNWLAPDHLAGLRAAMAGNDWAFSRRLFVHPASGEAVGEDRWESVGPGQGIYAQSFGGFVDPNCLMLDKLACEAALPLWCHPFLTGAESPQSMTADRRVYDHLARHHRRVGDSRRASVFYTMATDAMLQPRLARLKQA